MQKSDIRSEFAFPAPQSATCCITLRPHLHQTISLQLMRRIIDAVDNQRSLQSTPLFTA
jgi:hypothetical protein